VYGGGGVGLAGAARVTLLREEARAARRRVTAQRTQPDPPTGNGVYGRGRASSRSRVTSAAPASPTPPPPYTAAVASRRALLARVTGPRPLLRLLVACRTES
jgi:hypothetical protein